MASTADEAAETLQNVPEAMKSLDGGSPDTLEPLGQSLSAIDKIVFDSCVEVSDGAAVGVCQKMAFQFVFRHFDGIQTLRNSDNVPIKKLRMPFIKSCTWSSTDEAITDAEPGSKPASKKVPSDDSCVVILPSEVLDVIFHAPTKSLVLRPTPRLAAGSGWSTLSAGGPEATGTQCVIIRYCHDEPTNVPESVWMSGAVQVATAFQKWFAFVRRSTMQGAELDSLTAILRTPPGPARPKLRKLLQLQKAQQSSHPGAENGGDEAAAAAAGAAAASRTALAGSSSGLPHGDQVEHGDGAVVAGRNDKRAEEEGQHGEERDEHGNETAAAAALSSSSRPRFSGRGDTAPPPHLSIAAAAVGAAVMISPSSAASVVAGGSVISRHGASTGRHDRLQRHESGPGSVVGGGYPPVSPSVASYRSGPLHSPRGYGGPPYQQHPHPYPGGASYGPTTGHWDHLPPHMHHPHLYYPRSQQQLDNGAVFQVSPSGGHLPGPDPYYHHRHNNSPYHPWPSYDGPHAFGYGAGPSSASSPSPRDTIGPRGLPPARAGSATGVLPPSPYPRSSGAPDQLLHRGFQPPLPRDPPPSSSHGGHLPHTMPLSPSAAAATSASRRGSSAAPLGYGAMDSPRYYGNTHRGGRSMPAHVHEAHYAGSDPNPHRSVGARVDCDDAEHEGEGELVDAITRLSVQLSRVLSAQAEVKQQSAFVLRALSTAGATGTVPQQLQNAAYALVKATNAMSGDASSHAALTDGSAAAATVAPAASAGSGPVVQVQGPAYNVEITAGPASAPAGGNAYASQNGCAQQLQSVPVDISVPVPSASRVHLSSGPAMAAPVAAAGLPVYQLAPELGQQNAAAAMQMQMQMMQLQAMAQAQAQGMHLQQQMFHNPMQMAMSMAGMQGMQMQMGADDDAGSGSTSVNG